MAECGKGKNNCAGEICNNKKPCQLALGGGEEPGNENLDLRLGLWLLRGKGRESRKGEKKKLTQGESPGPVRRLKGC